MRSFVTILILCQACLFTALVISRNPNKIAGFEQSKNQEIDKFLLGILITFVLSVFSFKFS
jgi:hypothetical protein